MSKEGGLNMPNDRLQSSHIRLADEQGERTVRAPEGFCWQPYSPAIQMEGRRWEYFFCQGAMPHYRAVNMVRKPEAPQVDKPADKLKVGVVLEFRPGAWRVVKVYPPYPTGRAGEHRYSVDIEGPDGERHLVDSAFVSQWMVEV
jgi:hypothetical protein